jgi:hypothetical protein
MENRMNVSRGGIALRSDRPGKVASPGQLADESVTLHPLSILAIASGIRLDDPRLERERVVMLEVAIIAGKEAARALDRWLSQSLAEYRGSRSAWDLEATTLELRIKLDQYDATLRETADHLLALIPALSERTAESVSGSGSKRRGRRVLDEIAAASSLLGAIDAAVGRADRVVNSAG